MARDRARSAVAESEVMASVDDSDGDARFVIADVTADGAWLSTILADAAVLGERC